MKEFEAYRTAFVKRLNEYLDGKSVLSASKALGIPQTTISDWQNKKTTPGMEYLILLSIKTGNSIDYLVGLKDS